MFQRAEKKKVFLKLAVLGPSGSGKTMSALRLARGLAGDGKIAMIDTENDSASLYAGSTPPGGATVIDFDTAVMTPPFLVNKYTAAIEQAEKAGYTVLVVDSLTHAWIQLLDKKESLDSRGGNSFTNWATITKEHEQFKNALLQARMHIIGCVRSKQDYVLETGKNGKQAPKKVGMAPVQREGLEYEFTTVFEIGMDHQYAVSKDRTGIFDGRIEVMSEKTGEELVRWLAGGKEPAKETKPDPIAPLSPDLLKKIWADTQARGISKEQLITFMTNQYGAKSMRDLTRAHADELAGIMADEATNADLLVFLASDEMPPDNPPPGPQKPAGGPPSHAEPPFDDNLEFLKDDQQSMPIDERDPIAEAQAPRQPIAPNTPRLHASDIAWEASQKERKKIVKNHAPGADERRAHPDREGVERTSRKAIDDLLAYGSELGLRQDQMDDLLYKRLKENDWNNLNAFNLKVMRNAFEANKKVANG